MKSRFVVLLAGGEGKRLSPLSTPQFPKQFFRLPGERESLLQHAARTACQLVPHEQVITVTSLHCAGRVAAELQEIHPSLTRHILIEPKPRGTAMAAGVACAYAQQLAERPVLWLLPCDHDRRPSLHVQSLRDDAFFVAEQGHIMTFGIRPSSPDSGFGYLLARNGDVERFSEKPDEQQAEALIASGHAWWNSGMFVFPAVKMLAYMQHLLPDLPQACSDALLRGERLHSGLLLEEAPLSEHLSCSLDVGVMERVSGLRMLALEGGWSDIGTWPRLLAWWQLHAAHLREWDFGNGRSFSYTEAWECA